MDISMAYLGGFQDVTRRGEKWGGHCGVPKVSCGSLSLGSLPLLSTLLPHHDNGDGHRLTSLRRLESLTCMMPARNILRSVARQCDLPKLRGIKG